VAAGGETIGLMTALDDHALRGATMAGQDFARSTLLELLHRRVIELRWARTSDTLFNKANECAEKKRRRSLTREFRRFAKGQPVRAGPRTVTRHAA
jgi:hypothetical protein